LEKKVQKFKQFFYNILYPKQFRIILALSGALLGIGVAGGFFISLVLQKVALETKIDTLLPAAITFAFLGWLGSGVDILGLLREMYKDYQQERKKPTLIFDRLIKKPIEYSTGIEMGYFARIRIGSGEVSVIPAKNIVSSFGNFSPTL
jgi:ABC-type bacteriocin/lantibiotic exporter with double-glycine peptidase domain